MTPGRDQKQANRMGDAYSQREASVVLEQVSKDYDAPAKALKAGVESLYLGVMFGASQKCRKATAKRLDVNGIQLGGDNIDLVSHHIDIIILTLLLSRLWSPASTRARRTPTSS